MVALNTKYFDALDQILEDEEMEQAMLTWEEEERMKEDEAALIAAFELADSLSLSWPSRLRRRND